MTLTEIQSEEPKGSVENPFVIMNGPDMMTLMLALFGNEKAYFSLDRRRGYEEVKIAGMRKIGSNSGNWTVWGTIRHDEYKHGDYRTKFVATYMMQGGKRTGSLHYCDW